MMAERLGIDREGSTARTEAPAREFYSVEAPDYEGSECFGYFTDRAVAEAYCAEVNSFRDQYDNEALVYVCPLDTPREQLRGAWYVVLAPDGSMFSAVASQTFCPGEAARWVGVGYDDAPKEWGGLRQGFGLTREDAARAALTLTERAPVPAVDPSRSIPNAV